MDELGIEACLLSASEEVAFRQLGDDVGRIGAELKALAASKAE